ncbi:MAG: toll/interleukin-1 receptor domain-containing protein [Nitrosomonas sp. PRO4]|nr:toll/interleukin-1 receptor domain-containing protein [Nitrosomonas sp. PRO4]
MIIKNEFQDEEWDELIVYIENNEVIPIVGPGVVTFGRNDELLYPWLAQRVSSLLKPPLIFEKPPHKLQEIADEQHTQKRPINRIYTCLSNIIKDSNLRPGLILSALASIEGFKFFISTTFDPLLPRAIESISPDGKDDGHRVALSLREACTDLPHDTLSALNRRLVYQIFGRAESVADFAALDDDAFLFLSKLAQEFSNQNLKNLNAAFRNNHFLILGVSYSDCLLRFFANVNFKHDNSNSVVADKLLNVFKKLEPCERDNITAYIEKKEEGFFDIHILPTDPLEFIKELHARWRLKHPEITLNSYDMNKEHRKKHSAPGCIFVSYASPDLEIAKNVVKQLQDGGCLVWFDKEQLTIGRNWEEDIREAVEERCGLFISLISERTSSRLEGYNILERNWAAKRRDKFGDTDVFYLPIRIDNGEPLIPRNEPRGTKQIHAERFVGGKLNDDFIKQLHELQRKYCEALAPRNSSG